jgi:periplasmic divalent cation tolerance protein
MADANREYRLVVCTAGSDEQAETIARALVERRLAACVNIVGSTCSVYRWKGEVVRDAEILLLIKTTADAFERVRDAIRALHSYEVPEIIALPIREGDPPYLDWIGANVD